MAQARSEKNSVRDLQYGPQIRLARGISTLHLPIIQMVFANLKVIIEVIQSDS